MRTMTPAAATVCQTPTLCRGWFVCPNCRGTGGGDAVLCIFCFGDGVLAFEQHNAYERILIRIDHEHRDRYRGRVLDLLVINRGRNGGYVLP